MDPQLQALYARVKAREISPEEAAEQFKCVEGAASTRL